MNTIEVTDREKHLLLESLLLLREQYQSRLRGLHDYKATPELIAEQQKRIDELWQLRFKLE